MPYLEIMCKIESYENYKIQNFAKDAEFGYDVACNEHVKIDTIEDASKYILQYIKEGYYKADSTIPEGKTPKDFRRKHNDVGISYDDGSNLIVQPLLKKRNGSYECLPENYIHVENECDLAQSLLLAFRKLNEIQTPNKTVQENRSR